MIKITFISVGILRFTRQLVRDILTFPGLTNATILLMDIDAERREFSKKAIEKIICLGNYRAIVEATLDRMDFSAASTWGRAHNVCFILKNRNLTGFHITCP